MDKHLNSSKIQSILSPEEIILLQNLKLLVVEDNPITLFIRHHQLEGVLGKDNIHWASHIPDAVTILENHAIDVALIDLVMPGENGGDLIYQMKEMDAWKGIPIIVITGASADSLLKAAFKELVNAFLHKPVSKEELISTIYANIQPNSGA